MMKKLFSILLATVCVMSSTTLFACSSNDEDPSKSTKTVITVMTDDCGYGDSWLTEIKTQFESKYENVSFEEGKVGVTVVASKSTEAKGTAVLNGLKADVVFCNGLQTAATVNKTLIRDISDVIDGTFETAVTDINGNVVDIVDGGKTIEDKMYAEQIAAGKALDGKYYSAPWIMGMSSISYNADLWEQKKLYFAESDGFKPYQTSTYTGQAYTGRGFIESAQQQKSVGPDGVRNTYDDGMPSSYEEFLYLINYMEKDKGVAPFIVANPGSWHYTNYIFSAALPALAGKEAMSVNYNLQTEQGKTFSIISGFNGANPIVDKVEIDESTGYLTSQMAEKYYVLDLMQKIYSNSSNMSNYSGKSHTEVQYYYVNSVIKQGEKPIAMIIDGNHWYNEVPHSKKDTVNFKTLPMPRQLTGSVNEGAGSALSMLVGNVSVIVNSSIASVATEKVAKLFVRFALTDDMIKMTNKVSSMPLALKYDLATAEYNALSSYGKDLWTVYKDMLENDSVVFCVSDKTTLLNNPAYFSAATDSYFWTGTETSGNSLAYLDFKNNTKSAKDYFQDMWIDATEWSRDFYTSAK